jgi:hypothetical protein
MPLYAVGIPVGPRLLADADFVGRRRDRATAT